MLLILVQVPVQILVREVVDRKMIWKLQALFVILIVIVIVCGIANDDL